MRRMPLVMAIHRCPRRKKVAVTGTRDVPTKIGNNSNWNSAVGSYEAIMDKKIKFNLWYALSRLS